MLAKAKNGQTNIWYILLLNFVATYNIRSPTQDSEKEIVLCKKGDDITRFDGTPTRSVLHNIKLGQGCGSAFISSGSGSSILGWIPIRIQGFKKQKLKKNYSYPKKLIFLDQKLQFPYLSLGLHKERPSYRRSLQLSKEAIQHFKT